MASIKYTNNAKTTLAADLNNSATSATVVNGNLFPSLSSGEHFYCTFDDGTNTEIVKVTARSTHVLTIVRAQDNTSARAFSSGDKAELRITAVVLEEVSTSTSSWNTDIFAGDGSDTTFTLTQAATDEKYLQVFIDGVFQAHNTYSVSGTTLTFATAPANSRVITAYHIEPVALGTADTITATANNSANETVFPVFVDGATGTQGLETDTGFTYNPSSGVLTIAGELDAGSLDVSGNADIDGTLEADAITINGVTLAETISDTVGAMVSSNTETGIAVTYDDSDNTLDFVLPAAATITTSLGVGGGSSNGVQISQGAIAIKNGGAKSYIDLYCESGNAHYTRIEAAAHSAYSGNVTATLPVATGTLALTSDIHTTEELQDIIGAMFASNTETGITVTYQDGDGTIDLVVGTLNQNTTGSAATLTTARAIAVAGDVTGTANFDGSAAISITTTLATDAIVTANITDANVTVAKMAANSVDSNQYVDGSIDTAHIADSQITVAKMAANSVDSDQYVDGSIDTAHIADDQVTGAKIENAVTIATSATSPLMVATTSARITQVALSSSSNAVAWDSAAAANAYHVTTENTTFSAPSNAVEGAIISVELAQGGTARTIAWNTVFEFAASTAPTVTATANKTDIFSFRYNGSVWQEIGRVQNMAQT
tara:strand:- start:6 stop:1985 length:1980 start_codon:yes stop_codon:yes gene_type:complete